MTERYRVLIQWALLLLALAGTGIALYLTAVHYEHLPLLCSASGLVNCERVTSSPYSVLFGTTIPITVPGLAWTLISAALAVVGLVGLRSASSISSIFPRVVLTQFLWSLLGLLTVLYFVYVEIVLLHTICAWCTGLHVIILVMFLLTLVLLLSGPTEPEEQNEEEEQTPLSTPHLH